MKTTSSLAKPGIHEVKIRRYFGGQITFDGDAPLFDHPLYLLGFSNRSGSNLLANHLRSLPYLTGFRENLIYTTIERQAALWGHKTFPDVFAALATQHQNTALSWGVKASWDQIMMLFRFKIDRMFPSVKIIHMTRENLVEQAVSYAIAHQTQKWTSEQGNFPDVEPHYDFALIQRLMKESMISELNIRQIASLFALPYHQVKYSELRAHPVKTMRRVAKFTGHDLGDWRPQDPKIQKQADQVSDAFCARFIAESRGNLLR